jgi:flagellar biogenesis protein FliO
LWFLLSLAALFYLLVRVQLALGARDTDKLAVYQQVPIHYRDQIPIVAVIDQLVR